VISSVLAFDHQGDWTALNGAVSQELGNVSEGTAVLRLSAQSWTSLTSRTFSTTELEGITSNLAFDIFVPDLPADFYWMGGMNAYVECPSAGLWRTWLGYHALQILFDNEYNRIEFRLPPHVVSVLNGNHSDCRWGLDFSTNPIFGGLLVDGGGFVPETNQ